MRRWLFFPLTLALVLVVSILIHKSLPDTESTLTTLSSTITSSAAATTIPSPSPTPKSEISLLFGGDVMLGRYVELQAKKNGPDWIWSGVKDVIATSDLAIVNLESPFRTDASTTPADSFVLRGDPNLLPAAAEAGIDIVSLANNHIPDMGLSGLIETQQLLAKHSIQFLGAGESLSAAEAPLIVQRKSQNLGILAATYGSNMVSKGVYFNQIETDRLVRQVRELKAQVDVVIVFLHWGTEYATVPADSQVELAHSLVDAGASIIIGAHPHVPQRAEVYRDGFIAYSLGNLVFDQQKGEMRDMSALLRIRIIGSTVTQAEAIPYQIMDYARPILLDRTSQSAQQVLERFNLK